MMGVVVPYANLVEEEEGDDDLTMTVRAIILVCEEIDVAKQ